MKNEKLIFWTGAMMACSLLMSCDKGADLTSSDDSSDNNPAGNSSGYIETVAVALAKNCPIHEQAGDDQWDESQVIQIALDENKITVNDNSTRGGIGIDGKQVIITAAGTYRLGGTIADGQIIVDSKDPESVRLVLDGLHISNSTTAPIYIKNAEKAVIVLMENSENEVTDGKSYVFDNAGDDEPNAAIFSKADLTICGNGSLVVNGNFNDGISSKDGLIISGGSIAVTSTDDGIRGKNYLVIRDGNITVTARGDGLNSDNEDDAGDGFILIENGNLNITASGDAIAAQTDALISDGEISLTAGGGSNYPIVSGKSAKGIKGVVKTIIDNGTLTVNAADDAIHSNSCLIVNGGDFTLTTGDDGLHADSTLGINGGNIQISKCYEGIESLIIVINDGSIHLKASDDGVNAADGTQGGFMPPGPGQSGGLATSNYYLYINGGYLAVNAGGDGFDINGSIEMTNGVVIIHGPTANNNGAIDYDRLFKISGGFLITSGSSGMAMAPSTSSTQYSLLLNFTKTIQAETLFHIQNSEGANLLSFAPTKNYQSITFSSPELKKGATYDIYSGGSYSGAINDGLYQDGAYTPGTKYTSFTVSNLVTKVNSR
ncbi:MAG: carbohydrate-binding domain-containing protein [Calditrichaeota bacterium]|nr:MAG: carbohydrate-binding domain-containing protein [Calditrichota bacterium]